MSTGSTDWLKSHKKPVLVEDVRDLAEQAKERLLTGEPLSLVEQVRVVTALERAVLAWDGLAGQLDKAERKITALRKG